MRITVEDGSGEERICGSSSVTLPLFYVTDPVYYIDMD